MDTEQNYAVSETEDILIAACQAELEDDGEENGCAYYLRIENNSDSKIQVVAKDFNMTDEEGHLYSDPSAGFKGELPALEPGEYFEFADRTPVRTSGVLYGTCRILSERTAQIKDIRLPALYLIGRTARPAVLH
jgi:ApaG protein